MPESIQQWLIGLGFKPQEQEFTKDAPLGTIAIPYEVLCGHSLSSFKQYAARKEWVTAEEVITGKPQAGDSLCVFGGFSFFVYAD